jgi:DNA processing protein
MALGIDRHAHLGALTEEVSTIGVLGTGIDLRYPTSNTDLYAKMLEHGLLISEFPLGTSPLIHNFPRRNRIIAGLSLGCLVIESTLDGGSMISAQYALDMGREVMAIPGSIHNPACRGCHKLIKNGAKLVENINDIIEELYLPEHKTKLKNQSLERSKQKSDIYPDSLSTNNSTQISSTKDKILHTMGFDPIEIDKICAQLNLEFSNICTELLELELEGIIVNCGGGRYQRVFR